MLGQETADRPAKDASYTKIEVAQEGGRKEARGDEGCEPEDISTERDPRDAITWPARQLSIPSAATQLVVASCSSGSPHFFGPSLPPRFLRNVLTRGGVTIFKSADCDSDAEWDAVDGVS